MRKLVTWTATPVLLACLLVIVGSGREGRAQDGDEIRLGAFAPLTGISADVGAQIRAGIEVAVERATQQGVRVGGKPYRVKVLWYDDEGKADVGLNVVTRALTLDKIHVGVGFLSSDVFLRVMDEFQKARVPIIDACAAAMRIGDRIAQNKMTHVFQLSPTTHDMVRAVSAAVHDTVKPKKIALLNENTDGGRDFSRFTREWYAANAKDVEVTADEFVDRGITDLTPQFTKIKRSGAQAIIGEVYGSSAPVLYNQWFELRVPALIAHMGASVSAQDFIDKHQKVIDGHIINNRWWPAKYSELSEPMMATYKKKTGVDATNFAVQGHDATLVALEAVSRAGTLDADRIAAALETGTFVTAWGTRKFAPLDGGHRMPVEMVVIQVQGGKKIPIYPSAVAASAGGKFAPAPPYAWEKK
jgi:branched-chain amino acid transport system substrate-binding protein